MTEAKNQESPLIGLLGKTREELQLSYNGYYFEIFKGSVYDAQKKTYVDSEKAPLKFFISYKGLKIIMDTPFMAMIINKITKDHKEEWKESIRLAKELAKKEETKRKEQLQAIQEL